ncbi:MAG: hypothetical protein V4538_14105 [Bacteroidota bacterium]
MKLKNKHKFITSLILDDLINTKLVNALMSLDLDADQYYTNIGDKVMTLMGYTNQTQNEQVHTYYVGLLNKSKHISLKNNYNNMHQLAKQIYEELKKQKPIGKL